MAWRELQWFKFSVSASTVREALSYLLNSTMTYTELCQRILLEAQRGGERAELANLNTQSVIEAIMPSVLQEITLRCWANPDKRPLLKQSHTIAITNGVGVFPPTALKEALTGGVVLEPDSVDVLPEDISYVPEFVDFVAAKNYEPRLGYFSVKDDADFYYASPTEDTYNTFDGDIEYIGHTQPSIPADPDDETGWPGEVESEIIDYASELLRGAKLTA